MTALVLFDFDGTIADTAPDLAGSANSLRVRRGLPALPYERLRPVASHGARGLLRVALDLGPGDQGYEDARLEFLGHYAQNSTVRSSLFPGIADLLAKIADNGMPWGIVTNKATHLALPIVSFLGLDKTAVAVVCGDTTPHSKPHPEPLLFAARTAGVAPDRCIYVGDDLRDMQAGRAAGMAVIAAAYGYIGEDGDATTWMADACAHSPDQIWPALQPLLAELQ